MIKVNLLKDQTAQIHKDPIITTPKMSWIGVVYFIAVVVAGGLLGFMWWYSGGEIKKAQAEKRDLEIKQSEMKGWRDQFNALEQKKQERQGKINVIEKLQESQKGPVKLLNVIIQAVPQNREVWLTTLKQSGKGITVQGETRNPEVLPGFMDKLKESGIFAGVDVEQIERRDDISSFSILCTSK